jgi:mannosyltransferase
MSALSQLFFLRLLKTGKGWFWFGLTAIIGAYSHYFFMFTLVGEGIYFLMNRKRFAKGSLLRFLTVGILVLIALSPWLYYFHALGSGSTTRPHLPSPSTVDFSNAYSQFLFGFQNNRINTVVLSSWPIAMLFALFAIARGKKTSSAFSFIVTMATVPVILAYVISLTITPFFLSRYMISCVAPLMIVVIWVFSSYARRAAVAISVVLVLVSGAASYQQITSASTPVKENYQQAVEYINAHAEPQDLVVVSAPFTIYPVEYYYHGSAQVETLPNWSRAGGIPAFNKATLPAQIAAQNADHRYIYLLLSQDQGYETTIKQYYLTHFQQISHHTYSNDLTLYVYKVGFYTVPPISTPLKQNP